jgi:hypothetical protein
MPGIGRPGHAHVVRLAQKMRSTGGQTCGLLVACRALLGLIPAGHCG